MDNTVNPSQNFNEQQIASENTQTVVEATTAFTRDDGLRSAEQDAPTKVESRFYKNPDSTEDNALAFYLSRPVLLQSGTLSTTDVATTFAEILLPYKLLNNKLYAGKLAGRYGFRASLHLRLVVNAERFQQGRYMLAWCPLGGYSYNTTGNGRRWINTHTATITQRSNLPRVEFDLNCDTEATLKIPFSSVLDFYPFNSANDTLPAYNNWGVARLFPYSALEYASGSSTASYSIFGHFEDVEFINFAPSEITVQSVNPFRTTKKKKNPTAIESSLNKVGPVQSVAMSASNIASNLMKIPTLVPYTAPAKWVFDSIANVASVMGWSSIKNIEKAKRMQIATGVYIPNVNKVDNVYPLSLTTDNMLTTVSGIGSTLVDELDIAHFVSIPTYVTTFTWSTSDAATTQLLSRNVTPANSNSSTYLGVTARHYGPLYYLSTRFSYWRGSIIYKFKVVKTEFHSGRIAIAWFPDGGGTASFTNSDYVHRDIIDIREHSEFSILVPYNVPSTYLSTYASPFNGVLRVYVFDKLVAPDTVPSTIKIIVEVSGGPDFEFADESSVSPQSTFPDFTVQSVNPFVDCNILSKPIGTTTVPTDTNDTAELCIGERIRNLRTLLKKYRGTAIPSVAYNNEDLVLHFNPFNFYQLHENASNQAETYYTPDLYANLCSMFMYSRGSVRYKIATTALTIDVDPRFLYASIALNSNLWLFPNSIIVGRSYDQAPTVPAFYTLNPSVSSLNRYAEIEIPHTQRNKARNNAMLGVSELYSAESSDGYIYNEHDVCTNYSLFFNTIADTTLLRSTGEDFNLHLFVSCPPSVVLPPKVT